MRSVFAITDLGFVARSAREEDDSGEFRLAKIQRIIEQCKYGVHLRHIRGQTRQNA